MDLAAERRSRRYPWRYRRGDRDRAAARLAEAEGRCRLNALLVFVGGGSGALLRWLIGRSVVPPFGTLAVNIAGCLAMGLLAGWLLRNGAHNNVRLLLGVGLLGGFTTMSAFALETLELWGRAPLSAAGYAAASIAGSLAAVTLGLLIAR